MDFESVFKILLDGFKKEKIRAALIGGFAMHTAGHSRATQDIDFLVDRKDSSKIKSLLSSFGYDILHESEDVINFGGKLKPLGRVDFLLAHRKYTKEILERAKPDSVLNGSFTVKVILPEDMIGLKVQASSNDPSRFHQDMADIEALMKANWNSLNFELIREYFSLFEREKELDQIIRRAEDAVKH